MKNLKENRLNYEYVNSLGHPCKVTAYKSNKEVVVHDEVTNKFHECRWCDLHNPKCKAVFDANSVKRITLKDYNDGELSNKAVETPTINRKDYDEELVKKVKESENWAFGEDISARYQEEQEEEKGCAASAIVMCIAVVVFVTILCIVL